jgi:cathepsin L
LSEQNLIDCNKDFVYGNFGCYGGNMLVAYNFVKTNGISRSSVYPYRGSDIYSCTFNPLYLVTSLSAFELLPPGNETLVLQHLVAIGPLSAAMDSSQLTFQNYKSGVYDDVNCTRTLNHAVL